MPINVCHQSSLWFVLAFLLAAFGWPPGRGESRGCDFGFVDAKIVFKPVFLEQQNCVGLHKLAKKV